MEEGPPFRTCRASNIFWAGLRGSFELIVVPTLAYAAECGACARTQKLPSIWIEDIEPGTD